MFAKIGYFWLKFKSFLVSNVMLIYDIEGSNMYNPIHHDVHVMKISYLGVRFTCAIMLDVWTVMCVLCYIMWLQ